MTVIRWRPARYTRNNLWDFDRLLERSPGHRGTRRRYQQNGAWSPAIDISEREDQYVLRVELPGLTSEDIHVSMEDQELAIKGEKAAPRENGKENHIYRERSYGAFERHVHLNNDVETDNIDASYENGVLKISLPKTKESLRKEIPVSFRN